MVFRNVCYLSAAVEAEDEQLADDNVVQQTDRTTPDTNRQPDTETHELGFFAPDDADSDELEDAENAENVENAENAENIENAEDVENAIDD